MRLGYTVMWSGWQGDLIDRGTNVVAYLPEALQDGQRLRDKVRQEFSTIQPGVLSLGVSAGAEGGENVQPYPVLNRATASLTMRERERDPRIPVPASEWELARAEVRSWLMVRPAVPTFTSTGMPTPQTRSEATARTPGPTPDVIREG